MNDDGFTIFAVRLDGCFRAALEGAASTGEVVENAAAAENKSTGREIRTGDHGHHFRQGDMRIAHHGDGGGDDLRQVVRRDVGGHADGDARTAVDEQIGNAGGQYLRLLFTVVEVGFEVDRFLVDVFEERGRDLGQTRFGIPVGRGRIAIDGAKVSLAVHQDVAHGEVLRHADEGVINGGVAMRMELTENFTDDLGALASGAAEAEAHFAHGVENAAVNGLQSIADVG